MYLIVNVWKIIYIISDVVVSVGSIGGVVVIFIGCVFVFFGCRVWICRLRFGWFACFSLFF